MDHSRSDYANSSRVATSSNALWPSPSGWFRSQLRSPAGQEALNYLTEQRGLSLSVQDSFELGYAPDQWDGLLKHLQQVEGLAPDLARSCWIGRAP